MNDVTTARLSAHCCADLSGLSGCIAQPGLQSSGGVSPRDFSGFSCILRGPEAPTAAPKFQRSAEKSRRDGPGTDHRIHFPLYFQAFSTAMRDFGRTRQPKSAEKPGCGGIAPAKGVANHCQNRDSHRAESPARPSRNRSGYCSERMTISREPRPLQASPDVPDNGLLLWIGVIRRPLNVGSSPGRKERCATVPK